VAIFKIQSGPRRGKRLRINRDRLVIGRHPGCDIVLESAAVSRQHAEVSRIDGGIWLTDLCSRNGTAVNGRQITERHRLQEGDEVVVGDLRLLFSAGPGAGAGGGGEGDVVEGDGSTERGDERIVSEVAIDRRGATPGGRPEATLRAVVELRRRIGGSLALDEVLPRLLAGLLEIFPRAARGFAFLPDARSRRLLLRARQFRGRTPAGPLRLSLSLVERVARSRTAILSADAAADSRLAGHESIVMSRIRSVMCVPVVGDGDEVLAVLQVDSADIEAGFTAADLELFVGIADEAAQAVRQAIDHEERIAREHLNRDLELAHRVQQGLLPACPPDIPGYEVFDYYEAARQVGGDFFAYVPLAAGHLAFVLADVSGKGVSAALLMAALSSEIRYCLASEADLGRAVARINENFLRGGWEDRFATLIVAVLDPATHRLTLCNAGHPPALLREASGTVRPVAGDLGGLPLGMVPGVEYGTSAIEIGPGDLLVLCTDGIIEALDHELACYGLERLAKVLEKPAGNADEMGRRVLADVEKHAAGQPRSDDVCLVCVRRAGEPIPGRRRV
jgi:sigma-B regulation protein RsbU (phosphoserine phosphatase)